MTDICSSYISLLRDEGIEESNYRTSQLKFRLKMHFGDSIEFVRIAVTKPEIIVAASIPS